MTVGQDTRLNANSQTGGLVMIVDTASLKTIRRVRVQAAGTLWQIAAYHDKLYAAGDGLRGGVVLQSEDGVHWQPFSSPSGSVQLTVVRVAGRKLLLGGSVPTGHGVDSHVWSLDSHQHWKSVFTIPGNERSSYGIADIASSGDSTLTLANNGRQALVYNLAGGGSLVLARLHSGGQPSIATVGKSIVVGTNYGQEATLTVMAHDVGWRAASTLHVADSSVISIREAEDGHAEVLLASHGGESLGTFDPNRSQPRLVLHRLRSDTLGLGRLINHSPDAIGTQGIERLR